MTEKRIQTQLAGGARVMLKDRMFSFCTGVTDHLYTLFCPLQK